MKKILSKLFYLSCFVLIIVSCITALDKYTISTILDNKTVINISNDNKIEMNVIFEKIEKLGVDITVYDTTVDNGRNVYNVHTTDSTINALNGWFTCSNVKKLDINDVQFSGLKSFYVDSEFTEQVLNTLKSNNINVSSDFASYNLISILDIYKLFSITIIMLIISQFIKIVVFEKRNLKSDIINSTVIVVFVVILEAVALFIINNSLNLSTILWLAVYNLIYLFVLLLTSLIFCKIHPMRNFSKDWKVLSFHSISLIILFLIIATSFFGSTSLSLAKQSATTYGNNKNINNFSNYITFQVSANKENIDNNNITHYIDSMYELYNSFEEEFTPIIIDSSNYNIQQSGTSAFTEYGQSGIYVNRNYVENFEIVSKSVLDKIQNENTNILINKKDSISKETDISSPKDNIVYYDEDINLKIFDTRSTIEKKPEIIILPNSKLRDYMFNYFSNSQIFIELSNENDFETIKNIIKDSDLYNVIKIIEIDNSIKQVSFDIIRDLLFNITQLITIILAILMISSVQKEVYKLYKLKKSCLLLYRGLYLISACALVFISGIWFLAVLIYLLLINLDLIKRVNYEKNKIE